MSRSLALVAAAAIALSAPAVAGAAFPGRNGRIAFDNVAMLSVKPRGGLRILGPGYHPRHSRSGRMIAYGCGSDEAGQCPQGVGIRIKRADGRGRARPLTRNNWDNYPDWSADGHSVVFARYPTRSLLEPELWIYHRGHSRRLTQGEEPSWSIDGEIAFTRPRTTGGEPSDLYVIRPDGTNLRSLGGGFGPEWSPDGREIVYASNGCGYSCLYTIRPDGSRKRRVGRGIPGEEPDFSPDGRRIVYSGGQSDRIVIVGRNGRRPRVVFQAAGDLIADDPDWQSLPRRRR